MELSNLVSKAAPLLGSVLGGPLGGIAASLISAVFNNGSSSADELQQKIAQDPEAEIKLKQIEAQNLASLLALHNQRFQAANEDIQDARTKSSLIRYDWFLPVFSFFIGIGFFVCVGLLMFIPSDHLHPDIVYAIVGSMVTSMSQVVSYYYGSSHRESKMMSMNNNIIKNGIVAKAANDNSGLKTKIG